MRVVVRAEACAATGYCVRVAPGVFQQRSDGIATVRQDAQPVPRDAIEAVRDAIALCPSGAIRHLDEEDD